MTQFVDISKIIGLVDASKAEEFRQKNRAAKIEHDKHHDHHGENAGGGHSCGDLNTRYYIPEEEMSYVDKVINSRVSQKGFIKQNLTLILKRANDATNSIMAKARQRGI